jgi:D-lactate dehydrogenase
MIKRAKGFEMEVVAYDVFQNKEAETAFGFTYVTLEELLKKSDIISLHAPLLAETNHMISEEEIKKMKDGVVLINTARGGLIDTQALVKLLNKFRFVGLDVVEGEDSFDLEHPLLHKDNVIITPHMAFYSDASIQIIAEKTIELFGNFEKGISEGRVA